MISVELVPLSSFQRFWGGNSGCQASLYLLSTQQTGTRHFNTAETHATTTGVSLLSNSIALSSLSLPFVVPSPLPSLGNSSSSLLIALVLSDVTLSLVTSTWCIQGSVCSLAPFQSVVDELELFLQ